MQVTFQEVVGGARKLLCAYMYARTNVSKFLLCKKIRRKIFRQRHALAKLVKIFTYTV